MANQQLSRAADADRLPSSDRGLPRIWNRRATAVGGSSVTSAAGAPGHGWRAWRSWTSRLAGAGGRGAAGPLRAAGHRRRSRWTALQTLGAWHPSRAGGCVSHLWAAVAESRHGAVRYGWPTHEW